MKEEVDVFCHLVTVSNIKHCKILVPLTSTVIVALRVPLSFFPSQMYVPAIDLLESIVAFS